MRQRNRISCIHDYNGNCLSDEGEIASKAVKFFKSLLSADIVDSDRNFVNSIPPLVKEEDNKIRMAPFTSLELREVVFSMSPEKALGSDGFIALFFQKCWDFVENDVLLVLEESRHNRTIPKELNTTLISIIPKMENPNSFSDF
ncbi:uncharacterized protein LOC131048338 [Cryptomeria japonica]|uniref:uncharacterized protein LOC131048338 n=1 Tax=Cryptomeria japonica TaxID=3369 RepID=UPI0027DA62A2|nr:uncharacterized protein LOC131048338 [Cryptomeria japonica]